MLVSVCVPGNSLSIRESSVTQLLGMNLDTVPSILLHTFSAKPQCAKRWVTDSSSLQSSHGQRGVEMTFRAYRRDQTGKASLTASQARSWCLLLRFAR